MNWSVVSYSKQMSLLFTCCFVCCNHYTQTNCAEAADLIIHLQKFCFKHPPEPSVRNESKSKTTFISPKVSWSTVCLVLSLKSVIFVSFTQVFFSTSCFFLKYCFLCVSYSLPSPLPCSYVLFPLVLLFVIVSPVLCPLSVSSFISGWFVFLFSDWFSDLVLMVFEVGTKKQQFETGSRQTHKVII